MKKLLWGLALFFLFPLISLAIDYDITHYYIDAKVLENGDMKVQELIVLKGTFNGYERDIIYRGGNSSLYNASAISNISISAKKTSNDISYQTLNEDFSNFTKVTTAEIGESLKYIESALSGGYRYRMYYPSNKEQTAFLIQYTLKDVAIIHEDCAEIYWNFIGDAFEDDIRDLNIRVSLPKKDESSTFRWWFHGDLAGNSEKQGTGVIAHLDKNQAYSAVDNRILFDKNILNTENVNKKDNNMVVEKITAEEDEIVRKDLENIAKMKRKYNITVFLTISYYICLIITWIYVYLKYDKERKSNFTSEYNREFIDDYNVEVVDYLMTKSVSSNALSASILNLIYKKKINYEVVIDGKKKDYKFTLVNQEDLNEAETKLVNFLFKQVGKENVFTTNELKKYASGTKTCNRFMNTYNSWNRQVIQDGEKEQFFDNGIEKIKFGLFIGLFASIIYVYFIFNNVQYTPAFFTFFTAIIFVLYLAFSSKKTEKGIEHFTRWKAFKKFLNDFGTFDIKELPEIELWERYLVYATVFGLAKEVEKAMNVKIKEISLENGYDSTYFINRVHIAPVIHSSIQSSYRGAQTAITQSQINASGGSFGGQGGGFSSGGGFGGGGGGGRGF